MIERLTLIGFGLIGSSIARKVREAGLARVIVCGARSEATCQKALELGIADEATTSLEVSVKDADLVILNVPLGQMATVAATIMPHMKAGAVLSDTGSTKQSVISAITPILRSDIHLIPAHPIAGTEHSGVEAGFASLFEGRWCILTPPENTSAEKIAFLSDFWQKLGAKIEIMTAEHHDLVLAITSHVPHLIAYNIVGTASDLETVTESEVIKFSAGGFRDFTRIAASEPTMWRDVFLHNKEAVLETLGRFTEDLISLQRAIRWGDGDKLFDLFTKTRAIRRSIITEKQDTDAPDFGRKL
jgi:cyclohexadieny/prephenate dehydrogenase